MSSTSSDFAAASGEGYELQMGRFSRLLAPKFLDFVGLQDAGNLLDAGCGTGSLSRELLRRTKQAQVTGIDISPAYVAHAENAIGTSRATFQAADVTALPFETNRFDSAYSLLVLDFVPDTSKALAEILRVVKPEGKFAAAVWDARGGLVFNRFFLDTAAVLDPAASELRAKNFTRPLRRPGHMEREIKAAGFSILKSGEVSIRTEFANFSDYWAPFDGRDGPIPAYLSGVSPALKDRIKEAVRQAYLDGEEDGDRSYLASAWTVLAEAPR